MARFRIFFRPPAIPLIGAILAAGTGGLSAAQKEPAEAPPVLVSQNGGAPRWKNIGQLQQFAAKGDPPACFELGNRLMEGTELKQDYDRARALFLLAAQGGVADAWFRLGKMYHDGIGVTPDYTKAFEYYTEAAKRRVAEAQHNLGAMLVSGRGVKRDYTEGLAWLIVAGKSGLDASDESRVRERMAKKPGDIAAAEKRAGELWEILQKGTADLAPKALLKKTPEPPVLMPPESTTPPKVDLRLTPLPPPPVPGPDSKS